MNEHLGDKIIKNCKDTITVEVKIAVTSRREGRSYD